MIILFLFMAGCTAGNEDSLSVNAESSRSIKDLHFQGPSAECSEIKDVLVNPPEDITKKQQLIAELSLDACAIPVNDITVEDVVDSLEGKKIAYKIQDDILTVYAKHTADKAITCCSLQPSLTLIGKQGDDFMFAYRFQLNRLESARLEFFSPDFMSSQDNEKISFIGSEALPDRAFNNDELGGQLTTKTFESSILNEKRKYSIYVPPGFKSGEEIGLIVLGDGSSLGFLVREWEPLIASGKLGNFVAIGVMSGERAIIDADKTYDFDVRNADYIHDYSKGPKRFDKHLSFVVDELIPSVVSDLDIKIKPEKTVLMGGSSAGSFALWGVLKRPDMFGVSVGISPSGPIPEDISDQAARRRYFISAGLYEPGFRANAVLYDEILSMSGAQTDLKTYPDGHSMDHRAQRMVEVLPVLIPAEK